MRRPSCIIYCSYVRVYIFMYIYEYYILDWKLLQRLCKQRQWDQIYIFSSNLSMIIQKSTILVKKISTYIPIPIATQLLLDFYNFQLTNMDLKLPPRRKIFQLKFN